MHACKSARTQQLFVQARRSYADKAAPSRPEAQSQNTRIPLYALGFVVCFIPSYYFFHSDKPFRSEQAKIQAIRREHGTANETRDPRDSEIKTLDQKKAMENKNK